MRPNGRLVTPNCRLVLPCIPPVLLVAPRSQSPRCDASVGLHPARWASWGGRGCYKFAVKWVGLSKFNWHITPEKWPKPNRKGEDSYGTVHLLFYWMVPNYYAYTIFQPVSEKFLQTETLHHLHYTSQRKLLGCNELHHFWRHPVCHGNFEESRPHPRPLFSTYFASNPVTSTLSSWSLLSFLHIVQGVPEKNWQFNLLTPNSFTGSTTETLSPEKSTNGFGMLRVWDHLKFKESPEFPIEHHIIYYIL